MRILAAAGLVLCAFVASARADKLVVDRVDSRPARINGTNKVRALVSATVTGGNVVDTLVDEKTRAPLLKVKVGGTNFPSLVGTFENAEVELALVILVPTSYRFNDDFEAIRTSLDTKLLEPLLKLGPRVRVQLVSYGSNYAESKGFVRVADARKALGMLELDGGTDEMPLTEIVERAYKSASATLKKPKNKEALSRAAVLLISGGIDLPPDESADEIKRAISKIGDEAGAKQVRIHSFAYSPLRTAGNSYRPRDPLFALGELSLRSNGTFRWIQTDSGWDAAFQELAKEIRLQQVVTLFGPPEELEGKKLTAGMQVGIAQLTSDGVTVGVAKCGPDVCEGTAYCVAQACIDRRRAPSGGGLVVKALIFGGVGIGAMALLLGVLALIKRKRADATQLAPAYAVHPGQVGVPMPGHPVAPAPAPAPVPGGPVLIVLTGPGAGNRVPLRHGFTVGKAHGSDLDLSHDGFASGNHAQIVFDGHTWLVNDLGSTNGTFSNGVRITQQRLDPGTTVRFGSTEVRFWIG